MRCRPCFLTVVLLLATAVAGCSDERTTVLLADFEYEAQNVFAASPGDSVPNHLHRFGAGFGRNERHGRWILGREARLQLHASGARVLLEIDCSTTPAMSAQGQALNLEWNGYDLGNHPVAEGWQRVTVVGRVPPIAVEQGLNEIVLRPTVVADTTGGELPRAVFIKGLRLTADLRAEEIAELHQTAAAAAASF